MRILVIISILLSQLIIHGQDTKRIEVKFPKSTQIKELFSVLKSNPKIKHGEYFRYYKSPKTFKDKMFIKEKGNYKNGEKTGKWIYYNQPESNLQGTISKIEHFENGHKTGVWESHIYDNGDHIIKKYDIDIDKELETEIIIKLNYPQISIEQGNEGEVVVKMQQNTDCTYSNYQIVKSLDKYCDIEVLRRLQRLSELESKYGNRHCDKKVIEKTIKFKLE